MPSPRDPVHLSLSTSLAAYRPGETVTALLHASTPRPDSVELRELELTFGGVERVDTSWVSPAYRAAVPAANADWRRAQRPVVRAALQAATPGPFGDGNVRRYLVRFTLPAWLPPTFRGTAVRYTYVLAATAKFVELHPGVAPLDLALGPPTPTDIDREEAERGRPGAATARLALTVWPGGGGGGGRSGGAGASGFGDAFPGPALEEIPLKCWEVGAGTEVQDAVRHIAKLGSSATPSGAGGATPFNGGGGAAAAARGGSCADMSDAGSEISHDGAAGGERGRAGAAAPAPRPAELERQLSGAPAQLDATAAGGVRSFALRLGDQPLARLSVHPPLEGGLQPGSTLAGTLDFAAPAAGAAGLRCMQVAVLLETEEEVEAAWQPPGKRGGGSSGGGGGGALRKVYDEHVGVTADTACAHFVFSLPQDATPSFSTPLLRLRWVLRFQFTARAGSGRVEQLAWALPLAVLPPH